MWGSPAIGGAANPLTRSCPLVRPLGSGRGGQPLARASRPSGSTSMWAIGKQKKQRGQLLALSAQAGGDKTNAVASSRDQAVVVTASGVAPILPLRPDGGGSTPGGSGASPLHHVHVHSRIGGGGGDGQSAFAGGNGSGGAGPSGAGSSALPATGLSVPVGLPYQRLHVHPGSSSGNSPMLATGAVSGSALGVSSLDDGLARSSALSTSRRGQLCDGGLPDPDMCDLVDESGPPAAVPLLEEALSRGRWLLGLLIVQSTSSFVLDSYQDLLRDHLVVTLFLTMLVGAGGNAGNQSAIKVIRGLATGVIRPSWPSARATIREQAVVGVLLGTGLSMGGFVRVYATHGDLTNAAAISVSLFLIVMTSVVLGTGLPFALARAGVDPANAGTSIQVLMDILGVAITCVTCNLVLVQLAEGVAASGATAGGAGLALGL